jgi:1,4-dihydroxy-2-naphthoyl-CoA synthase
VALEIHETSGAALAIAKLSFATDGDSVRGIADHGMQALAMSYQTAESQGWSEGISANAQPETSRYASMSSR